MIKFLLTLFISLLSVICFAQQHMPSYVDVLKTFFTKYQGETDDANYTNFAKKKDGWYVQQINRFENDNVLSEKLFWNRAGTEYLDLSAAYTAAFDPSEFEKKLAPYLNYDWYSYERIPYFGYNNWQQDVITDFGTSSTLSDTLLDGLARSYSNVGLSYLWYQQGGHNSGKDTLQRKLERLELPSDQRIEKVKEFFNKDITQLEKLNKLNPDYKTLIGNINLKLFNENMYAYNQLIMCGKDAEAKKYLEGLILDQRYIDQAKNYLNSCDQNAILFTYGDNDTYQLWYVQEKLGYRKDIAVINNSLLGIAVYPMYLRRKGIVNFSTPAGYLGDKTSDVIYFQENKQQNLQMNLTQFIKLMYQKKYPYISQDNTVYPSYPVKKIAIKTTAVGTATDFIDLNSYIFLNDFMMLDIIDANLLKRPIYSTSIGIAFFSDHLVQSGIIYKIDMNKKSNAVADLNEIKGIEKFIAEKYVPVISNYAHPSFISTDGDQTIMGLYTPIISYYLSKNDKVNLKKWATKLIAATKNITMEQMPAFGILGNLLQALGYNEEAKKNMELYAQWLYDAYKNPSAINGFYSKEISKEKITEMLNSLYKTNTSSDIISTIYNQLLEE